MTNREIQYKLLIKEYDQKRTRAAEEKRNREREIYTKIPDIEVIDRSLNRLGINLVKSALSTSPQNLLDDFRKKNDGLATVKVYDKSINLTTNNYPINSIMTIANCISNIKYSLKNKINKNI